MPMAHPWFRGIDWDRIYQMEAAFIPEVNDELDTQNLKSLNTKTIVHQDLDHGEGCFHPKISTLLVTHTRIMRLLMTIKSLEWLNLKRKATNQRDQLSSHYSG
ncbi:unnamed protein product [Lactuca virosa]|uniref:AGC-kinase C-terminal domain-containing protein n=1 Tax=Lactuca virosa TaxID=75947 RepID=A0AAU9P9V4_9ASTR|nr:unnamed protein product [Lactuca virosa]